MTTIGMGLLYGIMITLALIIIIDIIQRSGE